MAHAHASSAHIVLVEDDRELRALVGDLLRGEGWRVTGLRDATALDAELARETPDLLILDINLPGEDGLSIARRLGARGDSAILMLTARSDDVDRIVGLEVGADDYLGKPFNPRELVARVRALLRRRTREGRSTREGRGTGRTDEAPADTLRTRSLLIEPGARAASRDGVALALTGAEFDLLVALAESKGRVLSRDHLLDRVHGRTAHPTDRAIDVLVSRLRAKIDRPGEPSLVTSVRNAGYALRDA